MSHIKPSSGASSRCFQARRRVRGRASRPHLPPAVADNDFDLVFDIAQQQAANPHKSLGVTSVSLPDSDSSDGDLELRLSNPADLSLEDANFRARDFAHSAEGQGFKVSVSEILTKEASSDIICDLRSGGIPALFASVLIPTRIFFKGIFATLIYLNGLIVDIRFARRGLCKRFLSAAGRTVDLVIGHTQNPSILEALRKSHRFVFPSPGMKLKPEFADAVAEYLKSIGRPGYCDLETGLVRDAYSGPLYVRQPPGTPPGFPKLEGGDGILVIASNREGVFSAAVDRPLALEFKQTIVTHNQSPKRKGRHSFASLIVGGGDAGRRLHVMGVRKAAKRDPNLISGQITIVERNPLVELPVGIPTCLAIEDANVDPEKTVVHVATGPADRLAVVKAAARLGFRFFVLEKPLTATQNELEELIKIASRYDLRIVINFPWLATPLTAALKDAIDSRKHGRLLKLSSLQTKSRRGRTNEAAGHEDSFDIETPHQVSLGLFLAGDTALLLGAECKPLIFEDGHVSLMGGASVHLNQGPTDSHFKSDLDSPIKERRIELQFEDGWRYVGWYPASAETDGLYLSKYHPSGHLWWRKTFSDDPLTSLILQAYQYFAGIGPQPASTLDLAVATANLISEAKCYCGLQPQTLESLTAGGAVK